VPFYQFTVPTDSQSAKYKADIAAAFTKVHTEVTGAPARYVNISFNEVPPGTFSLPGSPCLSDGWWD
jgi:phenylpyruvate tautomerase PptA (4-oxalocrotonate tautomerase family)